MKFKEKLAGVVLGLSVTSAAVAVPVTHLGGTFDVAGSLVDSNTATFQYTADFTNWAGMSDYIFSIDFKVEGLTIATIDSFSTTASGNWITGNGPTSANGCANNPNFTFACAEDDPFDPATGQKTSGVVNWNFEVTFTTDIALLDLANANNHIGAFFYDIDNCDPYSYKGCKGKEGLSLKTPFTDVPEPGTLALLGLGLLGLCGVSRRKGLRQA